MIYIQPGSVTPLYEQIYQHYVQEILSGNISAGSVLPATRKLASELSIGRNTVDKAYQQLAAEGYIQSKPGSGFTVNAIPLGETRFIEKTVSETKSSSARIFKYDFAYGAMDNAAFPYNQWRKSMNHVLSVMENMEILPYPERIGELKLRQEIAKYLHQSRAVSCCPDQIIITSGQQHSMEIIANMFRDASKGFAMEDPGYDGIRKIFTNHGFKMSYIPVESDGIDLNALKPINTDLVYVTPSHQFPTGRILSIAKRKELLQWAIDTDAYLIEDDYDSELRYYTNPIPSLQSLDEQERTIYTGTFSKSLAPSMRLAYIVFPPSLLPRYYNYYRRYNSQVTPFHQLTLAHFIESGNYERHINRLRTTYKRKQDALIAAIGEVFEDKAEILGEGAGIHLLLNIQSRLTQNQLVEKAASVGIKVYSTEVFYIDASLCPKGQLQLGFPTVPQADFKDIMMSLKHVWGV